MSGIIVSILSRMLVGATPLALAGVGGIFGERSGVTNIGLEGSMLLGAFGAAMGSYYFGNAWMGLICGVLIGLLSALIHAYLCVTVKIDHVVSGLAINIFATNLTVYVLGAVFGNKGNSPAVATLPKVDIPLLCQIPVVGPIFTNLSVITLMVPVVVIAAYWLLYKFPFGIRVLAAGQNDQAAETLGIDVGRVRYASILIGGFCCGLAGAFLSIGNMNMFVRGMVSGRGYIAIATILFGRYNPIGVTLAAVFFGLVDALQITLQGNVAIPAEFIQCLPYVLTILAAVLAEMKTRRGRKALSAYSL